MYRLMLALVLTAGVAHSPRVFAENITVTHGQDKKVHRSSSLQRQWYLINDSRLPLQLTSGNAKPTVIPDYNDPTPDYVYETDYIIKAAGQPIRGYELRFLVIDAFGEKQKLLSVARLFDLDSTEEHEDSTAWNLFSNQDAQTALYSIGYVEKVLTKSGQVFRSNKDDVLKELQKINGTITAKDIEP